MENVNGGVESRHVGLGQQSVCRGSWTALINQADNVSRRSRVRPVDQFTPVGGCRVVPEFNVPNGNTASAGVPAPWTSSASEQSETPALK